MLTGNGSLPDAVLTLAKPLDGFNGDGTGSGS
jgi:hypothetical protein